MENFDLEMDAKSTEEKREETYAKYALSANFLKLMDWPNVGIVLAVCKSTGIPLAIFIDTQFTFNIFVPKENMLQHDLFVLRKLNALPIQWVPPNIGGSDVGEENEEKAQSEI